MSTDSETIIKSDGTFIAWQPGVDIEKGSSSDHLGKIKGYCSTQNKDRQDETLLQKGLDFDFFIQSGFFNDNHSQETGAQVGVPDFAEYHPGKGWWTEGKFLKTPRAQRIVDLAKALKGTSRKLGFSVEGKVIERQGSTVTKAEIRHVAITHCPVNPDCTWELVAKALTVAGTAYGSPTGGSILSPESPFSVDHDAKGFPCASPGCKSAYKTKDALLKHQRSIHLIDPEVTATKVVRKALSGFSKKEAFEFVKKMRPNYGDELIETIITRAFEPR